MLIVKRLCTIVSRDQALPNNWEVQRIKKLDGDKVLILGWEWPTRLGHYRRRRKKRRKRPRRERREQR